MLHFLGSLFDTSDFSPRWYCGTWSDAHGWLHILSDLGVWSAYFAIPGILSYFVVRRTDLPFRMLFVLFAAFILSCGTTHLMEAIIFWWPAYRLAGVIKLITAVVSWVTIVALVPVVPKVLAMRSPEYLQREIAARTAELVQERERFRTTLASIGDAVIVTDTSGRITFLNEVAQNLTGWTHAAASGRPLEQVFRILDENTRQAIDNPATRSLREGRMVKSSDHTVLLTRDEREHPLDTCASPIRDEQGKLAGVVLVFRDVTERRASERELRDMTDKLREHASELETVMSVVPAAIWIAYDRDCRRIVGNRASYQLLRMPQDSNMSASADDRPFQECRGGHPVPAHELPMQVAASTGEAVHSAELDIVFTDGETRHLYGNAVPLRNSHHEVRGAISAFLDITDRKRAEAALLEAGRRKDEFLATLAHELRNPLAPITNALQLLRGSSSEPQDLLRIRDMIERQVHHMVRLVDDLLDVSRITRGKISLHLEPIALDAVLQTALETSRPFIDAGKHELTVSLPKERVFVRGDLTRLAQVTANLLNNAARYTPEGGKIALEVENLPDSVVIRIRDNGVGIPPALLPRVFDMFAQMLPGLGRSHGGLGIGLSLVKQLVLLHGGTIEALSAGVNQGSEFIVRLPAAVDGPPGPSASLHPPAEIPRRKVLVVDDNEDSAHTLAMLLKAMGHEVELAYDGENALAVARRFVPDVLLLDIGLPGMSGHEVAREIRQMPELRTALLIAQTGWGQDGDRRRSTEAGFDAHLVKPVDIDEVLRLMAAACNGGLHLSS